MDEKNEVLENAGSSKVKTFIFLDLEATGLPSSGRPRITEISLVAVHRRILEESSGLTTLPRILDKFTACVCPMKPIAPGAATLTGLHNDTLEYQKDWDVQMVQSINLFIQRHEAPVCLVAHNGVNFDFGLLLSEYQSLDSKLPDGLLCIDSLNMFREIDEDIDSEIVIGKTAVSSGKDTGKNITGKCDDSFVNHVKRKLVYSRESYEVNSDNKGSGAVNINNSNVMQINKKSSLFDPVLEDCNAVSKVNKSVDALIKDQKNSSSDGKDVFTDASKTSSMENQKDCSLFDGATLEYSYSDFNECDNVKRQNKSNTICSKQTKKENDTVNEFSLPSMYPKFSASNVCLETGTNSRPVSPGMEAAINDLINQGCFDEENDFNFTKQSSFELKESSIHATNSCTTSSSSKLSKDNSDQFIKYSPPPIQRLTETNPNSCNASVCVAEEKIKTDTQQMKTTVSYTKQEENSGKNLSQSSSTSTCSISDCKTLNSTPGKSDSISSTPTSSSKPQSPWYTPTRLNNSPYKKYKYSYKLMDIHKRVLGWEPEGAHRAEDDSLALLRICQRLCFHVCQWADKNAVDVDMIPPLYPKSPRKRKPLDQGVLPYKA